MAFIKFEDKPFREEFHCDVIDEDLTIIRTYKIGYSGGEEVGRTHTGTMCIHDIDCQKKGFTCPAGIF